MVCESFMAIRSADGKGRIGCELLKEKPGSHASSIRARVELNLTLLGIIIWLFEENVSSYIPLLRMLPIKSCESCKKDAILNSHSGFGKCLRYG